MIKLPAFPTIVWVLLAGTLLTRTAFFIVWPFVAIILNELADDGVENRAILRQRTAS